MLVRKNVRFYCFYFWGVAGINSQHSKGKLTARERIHFLLDQNSFEEIGMFVTHRSTNFNLEKQGPEIENNNMFPDKCNLTLAEKINKNLIKVRVWERGAGLTKACGTAACATAVAANLDNLSNSRTEIEFSLGKLIINIDKKNSIHMKGPVSNIKEIKINL